uniref:Uncharacterized protein n=1 Tax=Glossina brevipalpis TaxID=37001 RepID=A0A1A9WYY4_9MUSC
MSLLVLRRDLNVSAARHMVIIDNRAHYQLSYDTRSFETGKNRSSRCKSGTNHFVSNVDHRHNICVTEQQLVLLIVKRLPRVERALSGYCILSFDIEESDDTERTWTYDILGLKTYSSNPEFISFNISIEILAYRSATGSELDYQLLPFSVPRMHFLTFINGYYKDNAMNDYEKCSNLPVFQGKLTKFVKNKYELHECQYSEDGFPSHLLPGYYRLIFLGHGRCEVKIIFEVQVISKYV